MKHDRPERTHADAEAAALPANVPEVEALRARRPILWINRALRPAREALPALPLGMAEIEDAEARLRRFAPLLGELFEDTRSAGGIIESELIAVPGVQERIGRHFGCGLPGRLLVKADHALPVAGSVKARGGIYEVLHYAEQLAVQHGLLRPGDAYTRLREPDARALFSRHTVAVASTGNLGLSVGVAGAALGFQARVHMSVEAKEWKKERLRRRGVTVVEHGSDVTEAGRIGRETAAADPCAHFVDDENSSLLFLGYSVAALRMKRQLDELGVSVDPDSPLFVYLPCGLGGAPTGIAFGLKHVFGDAVHCFLAEPVAAPCVLLGMLAGFRGRVSVYDIGLHNRTEADGLAVATPSRLVGPFAMAVVSGCYTVEDDDLFRFLYMLDEVEGIRVEPSAAAGLAGPVLLFSDCAGRSYLERAGISDAMDRASHVVWTTGGLFVPPEEYERFRERGRLAMEADG
jgi:D-serine dehydratase